MMDKLSIHPIEFDPFTSFQKLYLPVDYFPKNCVPGTAAFIKISNNSSVICRLFRLPTTSQSVFCQLDDSVQFYNNKNIEFLSTVKEKSIGITVGATIKSIEQNLKSELKFKAIAVEVLFGKFNNVLMSNENDLIELIRDILVCYKFCENCIISVLSRKTFNYGIQQIFITNTSEFDSIGTISKSTIIKINKKYCFGAAKEYINLGGLDEIHRNLTTIIKSNLNQFKSAVTNINRLRNKILLAGPPGVGKTRLVHNLATENLMNLFEINCTDILRPYPGETEYVLRKLFQEAFDYAQSQNDHLAIILIKDIDQFCPKDCKNDDLQNVSRISVQLMDLLDKVDKNKTGVMVIATTSSIENLELKLRRPGRIDVEMYISLPTSEERAEILNILLQQSFPNSKMDLAKVSQQISKRTPGFVGSDLSSLVQNILRKNFPDLKSFTEVTEQNLINFFLNGLKVIRPSCLRESIDILNIQISDFDRIGGVDELMKILEVSVVAPLTHPESFARFSLSPPKGILLYGPPGCAKTTMAKYISAKTNMTFISVSGAEIYSPYVGNAEKFIVKIFNKARMSSPAIIFFDEIDALVGNRAKSDCKNDVQTRVLSTLLTEMDGIGLKVESYSKLNTKNTILVIAATNRPDLIDDALMRPGRFDKLIHVRAPDYNARIDIIKKITSQMAFDKNLDFDELSSKTHNFSGADLFNLCNEAALHALTLDIKLNVITQDDLIAALANMKASISESQIQFYKNFELLQHKF